MTVTHSKVWFGNCLFDIYKGNSEKIASNTTILNNQSL